jgi:hypothetical protein
VKIGGNVNLTNRNSVTTANVPSMVWTGSEYGVVWTDFRHGQGEIYFLRASATGAPIGAPLRVTNDPASSMRPDLAWNGTEYGVAWQDGRNGNFEIYATRVSATGIEIGDDLRVTAAAGASAIPSIVWTGNEYGLAWEDERDTPSPPVTDEIYFNRLLTCP